MAFWQKLFGEKRADDPIELVKQNLDDGTAVMLDVRSHKERQTIFLKDSIFISIADIKALDPATTEVEPLPKDKIIYCH